MKSAPTIAKEVGRLRRMLKATPAGPQRDKVYAALAAIAWATDYLGGRWSPPSESYWFRDVSIAPARRSAPRRKKSASDVPSEPAHEATHEA